MPFHTSAESTSFSSQERTAVDEFLRQYYQSPEYKQLQQEQIYEPSEIEVPSVATEIPQQPPRFQSFPTKLAKGYGNFLTGVGKGAISTITGASSLGERALHKITKAILPKSLEKHFGVDKPLDKTAAEQFVPEELRTPEGPAQRTGFVAERIAEFLAPAGAVAKAERGLGVFRRAAIEGGLIGTQRALQKGKVDNEVKTTALVAAAIPITLGGLSFVGKRLGEKIQQTVVRPTQRDFKDGFNVANINKHDVGGSIPQMMVKVQNKLNNLSDQLSIKLKGSNASIDLNEVYDDTVKELFRGKARDFGDVRTIQRVVEGQLKEEILEQAGKNGLVNLVQATDIKRGAGMKGAWAYYRPEPDASAIERVYTTFYSKLKTAIEKAAPAGVKEINKDLSELIPISNAIVRRIPVAARNSIISLPNTIGLFASLFNPKGLALIGVNTLSKSGQFGSWLAKVSSRQIGPLGATIGRLTGVGAGKLAKFVEDIYSQPQ